MFLFLLQMIIFFILCVYATLILFRHLVVQDDFHALQPPLLCSKKSTSFQTSHFDTSWKTIHMFLSNKNIHQLQTQFKLVKSCNQRLHGARLSPKTLLLCLSQYCYFGTVLWLFREEFFHLLSQEKWASRCPLISISTMLNCQMFGQS